MNKDNSWKECNQESIRVGKVSYKGPNLRPVGKILLWGSGIGLMIWGGLKIYFFCKQAEKDIEVDNAKSGNNINEHREASKDNMAEDDNRTDNDIRKAQALSDIRMEERRQTIEMKQAAKRSVANDSPNNKLSLREWINSFHAKFTLPDYSPIQFLASVLNGCPSGFEDAAMVSFLGECGALCFSKVRALYLDDKYHSPSIQVIVEGEHGSGKGSILEIYQRVFSRVIDADSDKMFASDPTEVIVQTAGINISQAKFYQTLANNQEVHSFAFESECLTVLDTFKKTNGLSFDYLRKAFQNETVYQNNMWRDAVCGSFRVFFNYVFTGTPKAISVLFNEDEVEGGTASRICFAIIPEVDRITPFVFFPSSSELSDMQDQIDAWRQKYCFKTVDGKDVACQEYEIDLGYVCDALQDWLNKQYDLSEQEGVKERNSERMRMGAIAFHFAIVLHMLAGEPKASERKLRKTVVDLTIYIANYCMERYLTKFSDYNPQAPVNETGNADETAESTSILPERRRLTHEELLEWYYLRGTYDDDGNLIGYGYIARQLNVERQSVINSFRSFKKNRH